MAALLGAQIRIFPLRDEGTVGPFDPTVITVGARFRDDKKAPTNPQIVDVLPVPGGLGHELHQQIPERRQLSLPLN